MLRLGLILGLVLTLASCGVVRNTAGAIGVGGSATNRTDVEEDGVRFRARTTAEREDKRDFAATASPFAINPEGAVRAARYQATRYCILTYGGSDTEWVVGPDTPLDQLTIVDDTVTLEGRCTQK